ncbi:MAG: hypothetical protein EXQ79_00495 [Acidimicrobiia bacterium]|nr:hypothetical protein [Acidimicrobiia bacterium]
MHRAGAVLALCATIALSACGGGGPSIQSDPDTSTTSTTTPEPTTSTTGEPTTSTTTGEPTTTTTAVDGQVVRYQGLQFVVPTGWPVYDLAVDPRTCVRADRHAAFLGTPGPKPDCPAKPEGHTETILVQPIAGASQIAVARATQPTVLNGMSVLIDPDPDAIGALTVVFPDLGLVAFLTYGATSTHANELLSGFTFDAP